MLAAVTAGQTDREAMLLGTALMLRDWLEWAVSDPRPERPHGLRMARNVVKSSAWLWETAEVMARDESAPRPAMGEGRSEG